MGLSSELASQFAKVTNDSSRNTNGTKLYGTITMLGEVPHVKLDGTEELTPISRTVEVAEGDRVEVMIANHSATVTGNLTDPSIGIVRAGKLESKITQTAEQIQLQVSNLETNLNSKITQTAGQIQLQVSNLEKNLDTKITQTAESIQTDVSAKFKTVDGEIEKFSTFKQTVEGFSFMGNGGTVKINGGDINLTGAISFSDLSDATTKQQEINGISSTASSALSTANSAASTANSALSTANSASSNAGSAYSRATTAINNAKAIANGSYSDGTFIDKTSIKSPVIVGGKLFAVSKTSCAQIDSDGFYLWCDDMDNPKASISYDNNTKDPKVQLFLGAGDTSSTLRDRFIIQKGANYTILAFCDDKLKLSGFTFRENGAIDVLGTFSSAVSTTVKAVWG